MTKQQINEIKKQIENDIGFKRTSIILLECDGKSFYSGKYEYVMFEVCGKQYQYYWDFYDDKARLYYYDTDAYMRKQIF